MTSEQILERVQELKEENKEKDEVITEQQRQINGLEGRLGEAENDKTEAESKLQDAESQIGKLEAECQELKDQAQELGITDIVHFLGWRDDVHRLLHVFDICALSSLWESFGLVLAEAMSLGVPCVGTSVDGIPEVIVDGETGLLVPAGEPEALAKALSLLLDDPALAERMGKAGLQRYEAMFTVERMVRRYEEALRLMA